MWRAIILLMLGSLIGLGNSALAQTQTQEHLVTVKLRQGKSLKGYFLQADDKSLLLEVNNERRTIDLAEVASISFSGELRPTKAAPRPTRAAEEPPPPSSAANEKPEPTEAKETKPAPSAQIVKAGRKALKALAKLADRDKLSLSADRYNSLLIDVKGETYVALSELPDGPLKEELSRALEAYTDAGQTLNLLAEIKATGLSPNGGWGAKMREKYNISTSKSPTTGEEEMRDEIIVSAMWRAAKEHITRATTMLNQP